MRIYKVTDISTETLIETYYDLSIFATGYEHRSVYVPQNIIKSHKTKQSIVFGYKEGRKEYSRQKNDRYFRENWADITLASEIDDTDIYQKLRNLKFDINASVFRVVVDYSTMSRLWYASILNWIRFLPDIPSVDIDFIYSFGKYKGDFSPLVIENILALPGYEGSPIFDAQTIAVFGLGFDGLATLGTFDQLEPNMVYGYLASPGSSDTYTEKAKMHNKIFITNHVKKMLELPISSVEITYGSLAELISPHRGKDNLVLIPMGPKPHVLAALLLCIRFEKDVSCLRVRGRRNPRVDVEETGQVAVTRVSFKNDRLPL